MPTKDELIKEIAYRLRLETIDPNDRDPARTFYDRIAEVATRELRIRCEEQAKVIAAIIKPPDKSVCHRCGYFAGMGCIRKTYDGLKDATCADGVAAYIEARVKERMGG
jgi:hypothetical protein